MNATRRTVLIAGALSAITALSFSSAVFAASDLVEVQSLNAANKPITVAVPKNPQRIAVADFSVLDTLDHWGLGERIVALPQTELRLLSFMMKQPEKAYSREDLLSAVWGFDSEVETRVTDETLRRIRKKLLQAGSSVSVSTIWGFGYKLKGAERT